MHLYNWLLWAYEERAMELTPAQRTAAMNQRQEFSGAQRGYDARTKEVWQYEWFQTTPSSTGCWYVFKGGALLDPWTTKIAIKGTRTNDRDARLITLALNHYES
jgi:hypothetical protein